MRILIATDSMDIGGAETHVFTLINELRKSHRVTLISSGGVYFESLKKSGIRCIAAPFKKRDIISIRKSAKIFKKEINRADIIHTHTRFTSFLAKKIRGDATYPKIVTTAHLNFPTFPFGPLTFWGEHTLAVSEDIKEHIQKKYNVSGEKISLTKNSVDFTSYKGTSLGKKLIVHTSRIDKGRARCAFLLVDAAKEILEGHSDWRIIIVGDGNRFDKLSEKALAVNEELGFKGIILAGARSDIPSILAYGSIFIGVSRSALEGMACGMPTIICGDEGYGGIVTDDNFSLLSRTNFCARGMKAPNKETLIDDIEFLISNDSMRRALGDRLQKKVEEFYPADSMAKDAIISYNRIFKRPSVCLVGYFGYHNLGDEETLRSAVKAIEALGISDISILCYPSDSYNSSYPLAKKYDRTSPTQISKAIDKSDVVILCGGNLLQNKTSLRSLVYYEQIIQLARRRRKRIYMISSGFGEISGNIAKFLLSRSIRDVDFCGCRTHSDLDIAQKYNDRAMIMPDLCFLLPEGKRAKAEKTYFVWIISEKETVSADEIAEIGKARGLVPIAVNLFKGKDDAAAENVMRRGIKLHTPKSFAELSKILSVSAFTVSERLHGSVFSIISHTPTYICADNDKKRAFLGEINSRSNNTAVLIPYQKSDVLDKKEIGVSDSDFSYVIDSLKRDIISALNEIF